MTDLVPPIHGHSKQISSRLENPLTRFCTARGFPGGLALAVLPAARLQSGRSRPGRRRAPAATDPVFADRRAAGVQRALGFAPRRQRCSRSRGRRGRSDHLSRHGSDPVDSGSALPGPRSGGIDGLAPGHARRSLPEAGQNWEGKRSAESRSTSTSKTALHNTQKTARRAIRSRFLPGFRTRCPASTPSGPSRSTTSRRSSSMSPMARK